MLSKLQFSQWISGLRAEGLWNCLFRWRSREKILMKNLFRFQLLCPIFPLRENLFRFSQLPKWNVRWCTQEKCVIKFNVFKSAITIRLFLFAVFTSLLNCNEVENINFETDEHQQHFHQVVKRIINTFLICWEGEKIINKFRSSELSVRLMNVFN